MKKKIRTARCMDLSLYGMTAESGSGSYFFDTHGKKYLDFFSAGAVNNLGYGREDLARTYYDAAKKLQHSMFCYTKNEEANKLAESLIEITPGSFEKLVAYGTSGSDSIDGAVKMARKYTGKKCIISFVNAYHGSTGFSISTNGFNQITEGISDEIEFFKAKFPTTKEESRKTIETLKYLFDTQKIAGLLIEPIQGDSGIRLPYQNFLKRCAQLTHRNGAVFIVDEIQTGMGRTGKWWASEHFDINPDILITAKGLSAGFAPISAIVGNAEIVDSLNKAQHIFTYSGHPPSCAVSRKVIQIIKEENLIEKVQREGAWLQRKLSKLQHPSIKQVRGKGLLIGVETWKKKTPIANIIATRCMELGTYFGYYGTRNEVIRVQPPYTITRGECIEAIQHLDQSLEEFQENRIPKETWWHCKSQSQGLGETVQKYI